MDVAERDRRYLAREEPAEGVQVARSEGCLVFDHHGKKYIDFTAGWCVGNLGWGNADILAAIRGFDGPAYVHPDFLYRPWSELAEALAEITPGKLRKCYRATGGSEAVEIALQVAMAATGRPGFVCLADCYHGNTLGGRSLAGEREAYPNLLAHCHHVEPPLDDRAADRVERLLKGEKVAAFVMEPVVCNLGVLIPSKEFMARVRGACRKHGTLFVADEVATGFGRTGKLFASEHFDLDPDVLCLAKAITAGYAPMGATIVTDEVAKAAGVGFYSTYGWHPLSVSGGARQPEVLGEAQGRAAGERGRPGRLLPHPADANEVRRARVGPGHRPGDRGRVRRGQRLRREARGPVPGGGAAGECRGGQLANPVPGPDHRPAHGRRGTRHPPTVCLTSPGRLAQFGLLSSALQRHAAGGRAGLRVLAAITTDAAGNPVTNSDGTYQIAERTTNVNELPQFGDRAFRTISKTTVANILRGRLRPGSQAR